MSPDTQQTNQKAVSKPAPWPLIVILTISILGLISVVVFVLTSSNDPDDPRSSGQSAPPSETSTAPPSAQVGELPPIDPPTGLTVREDSRRLNDVPDSNVTFVEFLDFECEACASVYPVIEDLRQQYGDRVSFVIRYFPLTGHFNSERAARAVEAAAQQGQLEAMYAKMYETQAEWGEQQVPKDDLFRQFAEELGLDMEQWEEDYNSPETLAFIQSDIVDGQALGVQGTPTFFLNEELIQPESAIDLVNMIEEALNE